MKNDSEIAKEIAAEERKRKKSQKAQENLLKSLPVIAEARKTGKKNGYKYPDGVTQDDINIMKAAGLIKTTVHIGRDGVEYMRIVKGISDG